MTSNIPWSQASRVARLSPISARMLSKVCQLMFCSIARWEIVAVIVSRDLI
ncbi:MAG: hypothetical protein KME40_17980 [Komarekiella atlantica HA4396-MV6]|nr:hypothetical protein [Komarekiella atlantica HA4396-MV6]